MKRLEHSTFATRHHLGVALLLLLSFSAVPARAGYYKLVRMSGSGTINQTGRPPEPINTYWEEGYGSEPGGIPLPVTEVNPDSDLTCTFTETYEFEWVEDYPGETPQPETWGIDWDHTLTWWGTSGLEYESGGISGYTKATVNTSGGTSSHELSGSATYVPPGPASEQGDLGELIGWLEFPLNGHSPSVTVAYEAGIIVFGPVFAQIGLQRGGGGKAAHSVSIINPSNGAPPVSVGANVDIDVDYSTTRRGKAGAPVPPGKTPTPYKVLITVQPPSGAAQTMTFQVSTASGSVAAGFVPNAVGGWKIFCALEVSDGKKWHRVATTGPRVVTVQ
jgi:hypothetical protein